MTCLLEGHVGGVVADDVRHEARVGQAVGHVVRCTQLVGLQAGTQIRQMSDRAAVLTSAAVVLCCSNTFKL